MPFSNFPGNNEEIPLDPICAHPPRGDVKKRPALFLHSHQPVVEKCWSLAAACLCVYKFTSCIEFKGLGVLNDDVHPPEKSLMVSMQAMYMHVH